MNVTKLHSSDALTRLSEIQFIDRLGPEEAALCIDAITTNLRHAVRLCEEMRKRSDDQLVFPLMADEPFRPQRDVVLSIRPQYSAKIMEGRKTVELRRRFPVSAPSGTMAYIYSTSPVRAMVGIAEIKDVLKLPVQQIWSEFEDTAFIQRHDFDRYFHGLEFGFALLFEEVKPFSRPVPLTELREKFGFEPPQSFLYASRDLRKALRDEATVVSH